MWFTGIVTIILGIYDSMDLTSFQHWPLINVRPMIH